MKKNPKAFDYTLNYRKLNLRQTPHFYRVGKGEQGVLLVQPYKSEILPFWRFKTPEIAKKSADTIYELFIEYKKNNDFVGMDMARKYLQMGVTRSMRYYYHKSGKKYIGSVPKNMKGKSGAHGRLIAPHDLDLQKKKVQIFLKKNT